MQQHEAQLTQSPGVLQASHDSSAQPQVTHDDEADTPNTKAEPMPNSYHLHHKNFRSSADYNSHISRVQEILADLQHSRAGTILSSRERLRPAIKPKNVTGIDNSASIPKPTQRPTLSSPLTRRLRSTLPLILSRLCRASAQTACVPPSFYGSLESAHGCPASWQAPRNLSYGESHSIRS